ncbi:MAG: hypothetical protein ACXWA3_10370 [Acidimicrobiales bacterium]
MTSIEGAPASEPSIDLAGRLAEATCRARGVARLAGAALGGAATYAAGRRVEGVRLRPDHIEIHVVASGSVSSLLAVADEVRRLAGPVDPSRRIDVFIDDFDPDIIDLDAADLVAAST